MSQLIQMRQRINAIGTIKKITHATRLIAMSAHTRLANREPIMAHYKEEVKRLFGRLLADEETAGALPPVAYNPKAKQTLIVLVGSQKGFCGMFNSMLFKFLENHFSTQKHNHVFIAVGKKAHDYLSSQSATVLTSFTTLSSSTIGSIADVITTTIIQQAHLYNTVVVINNYPKSFFNQKPQQTLLLPIEQQARLDLELDAYYWPEAKHELVKILSSLYIHASVEALLLSSLTAEQAARFHSMDSATRNAQDLLETLNRDFNKLRQTKITKELIELSGSFHK
jgi:F-type H+-transporting ATPase subunit gamma